MPAYGDLDSRLRRVVTIGAAGMVRTRIRTFFGHKSQQIFCLSCGRSGGWVTIDMPPGVIFLCRDCERTKGKLPNELVGFEERAGFIPDRRT